MGNEEELGPSLENGTPAQKNKGIAEDRAGTVMTDITSINKKLVKLLYAKQQRVVKNSLR